MLELPDGTKARGYLNTHMSINLICEDWLVEEKGWDITHGRDHKGNGIKKYTTPQSVALPDKTGHRTPDTGRLPFLSFCFLPFFVFLCSKNF